MDSNDSHSTDFPLGATSALAGAAIGLTVGGPAGVLVGAAAPEGLKSLLHWVQDTYNKRRSENVTSLIARAADNAGLSPPELLTRLLETSPEKRALFILTVKVAQDAAVLAHLVALAQSLSKAVDSDNARELNAETAFVRAIEALDSAHTQFLRCFVQTANENHLGDGSPEFDTAVIQLNDHQLELVRPDFAGLVPVLIAGLQSHGLVTYRVQGGGYGGGAAGNWTITDVGRAFLDRLIVAEGLLKEQ